MKHTILLVSCCIFLTSSVLTAKIGTAVTGGDMFNAANWDDGLPTPSNPGTVNLDCFYGWPAPHPLDFNQATPGVATVSHTAGLVVWNIAQGSAYDWNVRNDAVGGAVYNWNQSGGNLRARVLYANNNVNYTLSGTGQLTTLGEGGTRINPLGTGTFTQTGGTMTGFGIWLENASTLTLSGGTATGVGDNAILKISNAGAVMSISGTHSMTLSTTETASNILDITAGKLEFNPEWTGSWTRDNFSTADWITVLTEQGGVFVGSTEITAGNFADYFNVAFDGGTGSAIAMVPEPATMSLLVLGGIAMLKRKKK